MMIFLTLVFFVFYMIRLLKGKLFYNLLVSLGELQMKVHNKEVPEKEGKEQMLKSGCGMLIFETSMFVILLAYLVAGLPIDPYRLPTVIILGYIVLNMAVGIAFRKDNKMNTESDIKKFKRNLYRKYTFRGIIFNAATVSYFSYMFYVLVFGL